MEAMKVFADCLKESYMERKLSAEEQWPPVSSEKLVNLQLVEAEKKKGFRTGHPQQHGARNDKIKHTPILHGDLFKTEKGKKSVRMVVVEGNAGAGKTTLCTMLTEDWAVEKRFNQFNCVILLPLRNQLISSASSLSNLVTLYHPDDTICELVVKQLTRTRGKDVFIIADGWDELSEQQRAKGSFIYDLLLSGRLDLLPSATVLLTSRPTASAPLHNLPTVDRLVEVVGFNEENIKEYIESQFEQCPEKASSLLKQLEINPAIWSVCSVPLNCAIICHLWDTFDRVLPSTLTEFYSEIVLNIILRDFKKKDNSPTIIENFDAIPATFQYTFWLTCSFAYECLSRDQIVFSESELTSIFPEILKSSDKLLCFGLLQSARSLLSKGQRLSFHFTHLTIQEFLAALHLVSLPNEAKLRICDLHARSDRFAMVWRFVFGLGCMEEGDYSTKVVCLNDEMVDRFVSSLEIGDDQHHQLLLCHCSKECSGNTTISDNIAKRVSKKFEDDFGSIASTPSDCLAVLHVLSHTIATNLSNITTIYLTGCGLDDQLLIKLTDILFSASSPIQVKELYLTDNKLTSKSITDLFNRARASFARLKELQLDKNNIIDMVPLPSYCKSLNDLDLASNPLGASGIQSLEIAVQAGVLVKLKTLNLSDTFTDDTDVNGKLLSTLLPAIATNCPHLNDFDLSENNLGIAGACALGEVFHLLVSNKDDFNFDLSGTNMSGQAAVKFSNIVTSRTKSCDSSGECDLDLSKNPLGIDGLSAIFKIPLGKSCPIAWLRIRNTDLTTPTITESHNCNIQHEDTMSMVTNLGCTNLPQFSSTYNILKYLGLEKSLLGELGVRSLETTIQAGGFVNLEELNISHSLTDDADVNGKLLTTLLPSVATHCPHLTELCLSDNNLGVPGACAVGEAFSQLVENKDEFELDLVNTNMSGEAAIKFSDNITSKPCDSGSCKCNLDFSKNPLGNNGLSAIFKILLNATCPIARLEIMDIDLKKTEFYNNIQCTHTAATDLHSNILPQFSSYNNIILEDLNLSNCLLGESGVKLLEATIQAGEFVNLEDLNISHTLTDDADVNGKLLTTLLPSIATHCPHLEYLYLNKNNLGVPGAHAVGEAFLLLVSAKDEFYLDLRETSMNDKAVEELSSVVTRRSCDHSCKCDLDLSKNPLGIGGLLAIFIPITALDLSDTDTTFPVSTKTTEDDLTSRLMNFSLDKNNTLRSLELDDINYSGDRIHVLAECIRACKALKDLSCWSCSLTSRDIITLLSRLKSKDSTYSHKNLCSWNLFDNSIDNEGVNALIKDIPELFPCLEKVDVDDNLVSDKVKETLKKFLKANKEEKKMEAEISALLAELESDSDEFSPIGSILSLSDSNKSLNCEVSSDLSNSSESLNSLSEEIDGPVGLQPTVADDTISLTATVQSSHQIEHRETISRNDSATVTSAKQTPPSPHGSAEVCGLKTVTIEQPNLSSATFSTESTPVTIHKMNQSEQETIITGGTADVTTLPQSTVSLHDTLSGACGPKTVTIEELKDHTKVTDFQLDTQIEEEDIFSISAHFSNVESYLGCLRLTPSQRTDIKDLVHIRGTQIAMSEALRLWREPNPYKATYRALVELLLNLGKGKVAIDVCNYLSSKSFSESHQIKKVKKHRHRQCKLS